MWHPAIAKRALIVGLVLASIPTWQGVSASPAPVVATLHPAGGPSDKLKKRWEALSEKNLGLLLRCLEYVTHNMTQPAIETCGSAIALDPTNPGAYKLRGSAFLLSEKFAAARTDFEKAISLESTDAESYAGRGDALRGMGRVDAAIASYSKALSMAPNDPRLWNSRCWARAISQRSLTAAHADCDRAIALKADFAQAFDSRGLVHLKQHRYADAITDYSHALRLWPSYALAYFGRGVAEWRGGQTVAATRDLNTARQKDRMVDVKFASYGVSLAGLPAAKHNACHGKSCRDIRPTFLPKPKPPKEVPPPDAIRSAAR